MNIEALKKLNTFMTQHTDRVPLFSVRSTEDNRFKVLRTFLNKVFDDVEDNAWSVGANLGKFVDALNTMEPEDINKITISEKI